MSHMDELTNDDILVDAINKRVMNPHREWCLHVRIAVMDEPIRISSLSIHELGALAQMLYDAYPGISIHINLVQR